MKEKNAPAFIEAITYRWFGHVDWREDVDVGVGRSKKQLEEWKKRDPVSRLEKAMNNKGIVTLPQLNTIKNNIRRKINTAWSKSIKR